MTLRNYRAFGPAGVRLPLGVPFVATIGVNNSGKSSLLKSLFELRPVLAHLASIDAYTSTGDLFSERHLGGPILNLGPGERVHSERRPGAAPRVTFEVEASTGITELTIILAVSTRSIRLEMVTVDGDRTQARYVANNSSGLGMMPVTIEAPLVGGSAVELEWAPFAAAFQQLASAMYVPAFRNALGFDGGEYYDLQIGKELLSNFGQMKNGNDPETGDAIVRMSDGLREIFGFKTFEIAVSEPVDHFIFFVDGVQRRQSELGAGLAQFVILAVNILIKSPSVLLLDEPELNLHARLQLEFLVLMSSLTSGSVLFATHSLGLARSAADVILVASKTKEGDCTVEDYSATTSISATLGAMGYGGQNDHAYKAILLVEGVTDVRVAREFLSKAGVRGEVVIVPLGGDDLTSGGRDVELEELTRLSDRIYALVDSERLAKGGAPSAPRVLFEETCRNLGIQVHLTERRAIENYLDSAVATDVLGLSSGFKLGHFERPKDLQSGWKKGDNWRVARHMKWISVKNTDVGKFVQRIAREILESP